MKPRILSLRKVFCNTTLGSTVYFGPDKKLDVPIYLCTIFLGACYQYNIEDEQYEASEGFMWKWKTDRFIKFFDGSTKKDFYVDKSKWIKLGFMGHNFLYNDEGIVFSTPLALSTNLDGTGSDGSESGTLILKEEDGKKIL